MDFCWAHEIGPHKHPNHPWTLTLTRRLALAFLSRAHSYMTYSKAQCNPSTARKLRLHPQCSCFLGEVGRWQELEGKLESPDILSSLFSTGEGQIGKSYCCQAKESLIIRIMELPFIEHLLYAWHWKDFLNLISVIKILRVLSLRNQVILWSLWWRRGQGDLPPYFLACQIFPPKATGPVLELLYFT